ncbi:MAG: imidazolonepropionase [Bacteroidetes bacterium]|nr:imidazolonepropionase [Bacteroidota bacterium]MBU1423822.1 imidazolonepropionase [Bacteroidota bacterium]MBU2472199.1 imidazolonepropionase [Bacteroidota bacterium]
MNLILTNIKQLVTISSKFNTPNRERTRIGAAMRNLGIIEDAALIIQDGYISWYGKMIEMQIADIDKNIDEFDCSGKVVMPGFVDSHTHLVFGGSREEEFAMRSAGATYQEIAEKGGGILNSVRNTRKASKKDLKKPARKYLNAMLRQGTTTVEIKSGYGLDMDTEIKMLEAIKELQEEEIIRIVPTFIGAHAIPPEYKNQPDEYVKLVCERMIPYIGQRKLADFCDVFCEKGYFTVEDSEKILNKGKEFGLLPKIHADELNPFGGAELAGRIGALSADHLEHISDEGIEALKQAGVVAVLLPGVSFFLNHQYAPARKIIDNGVPVAIASDFNPGSCMSYSMQLMMTIACTHMRMSPEEVITASTINAAAALNLSDEIGSIDVGKRGDVIILDIPNYKFLPYHFGENHVYRVVKNGVLLEF